MSEPHRYGIAAAFQDAGRLVAAARAARAAGYRRVEAYSPCRIKELDKVFPVWDMVSTMALVAGAVGGFAGYYVQYFVAADVFPINVGGRPLNSWPAFAVITFEMVVLFAVCTVFLATLFFEGLPALYHPLFRIRSFRHASSDGFFLCIEARDGKFDPVHTRRFFESLNPIRIWEVDSE